MKTKQLLLIALALTLPLAGAHAALITTNTALSPGDLLYEGADLIVSNCTLTVNGAHNFASLLLTDGAVLTHSPAPNGEPDDRLDLTITNDLTVDATSRVDANARGYAATNGPGKGLGDYDNSSSGGHGGPGGNGFGSLAGGGAYDAVLAPSQWGSGGGNIGSSPSPGGAGGGVIRLNVGGVLTVAGQLSANGEGTFDSGGAGGSIHLTVGTLAGAGTISAKGGDCEYVGSGGGGGGRIAMYYGNSLFSGALSAAGGLNPANAFGNNGRCGGVGTLYVRANSASVGDLLLDNSGRTNAMETPITAPVAYRLTLTNATAYVTEPLTLTGLRVSANGLLTHPFQGPRLQVLVHGNAVVEGGGAVAADTRGYPAQTGPGKGNWLGGYDGQGSGAGHGGQGGACWSGPGGVTYDSETEPVDFGSGGGGGSAPNRGGGAIQLTVEGTLTVDGRVSVNADTATGGYDGGGAGGSVWLTAGRLNGVGSITANGQVAAYVGAGSGGGGRIAMDTGLNQFTGSVMAGGGMGGWRSGENGTVHYGTNVPSGLVSWWRGEGNAVDETGAHPGTPQGGLAYAPGQVGQAFSLNGQDAAVALGNWFTNQQFTLSFWVKPNASQAQYADLLDNVHSDYRSWAIQYDNVSDATRSYWHWGTSLPSGGGSLSFSLATGAWQHWVVTLGADRVQHLYLDGRLTGSTTNTAPVPYDGSQYFNLGKHQLYGRYFNGMVDELMCFDRALGAAEVAALHVSQGGRPTLEIQPDPGGVLLLWPASAEGFELVSRSDLAAGAWEPVTNTAALNGTWKEVLLPASDSQRFFRLKSGN
jgi:hypothetical protein